MTDVSINWWAILVAVVANFAIGGLWYSPLLFLGPWLEMARVSRPKFDRGIPGALVGDLVASLAMAFVLNLAIRYVGANDLAHGLLVAFLCWAAFMFPLLLGSVTYEHRPLKYFAINAAYRFVAIMVMATILTLWR